MNSKEDPKKVEIELDEEEKSQLVALDQNLVRLKIELADADLMVARAETERAQSRERVALALRVFEDRVRASAKSKALDPAINWNLDLSQGVWTRPN